MDREENQLPQNISIIVGESRDKPFFDRHFGPLMGVLGAATAAVIAAVLGSNLAEVEYIPRLEIISENPTVDSPVKFSVVDYNGVEARLTVAKADGDEAVDGQRATRERNGILHSWTPTSAGKYVAELQLLDARKRWFREPSMSSLSEGVLSFSVGPKSSDGSASDPTPTDAGGVETKPSAPDTAEKKAVSQTFTDQIGNNASCTESGVTKTTEFCLAEEYTVTDWEGNYVSVRNGSAVANRSPTKDNCVVLTMQYSDSGRGVFGDCRGNGWVSYQLVVNGIEK